jgi:hemerythrin-like domain-containing protein
MKPDLIQEGTMPNSPKPVSFSALDASHQQMLVQLKALSALAERIEAEGIDADAQQQADQIETFFSGTSRAHHAQEEKMVFPPILAGDDDELKATVTTLQQDHGWIEENWIELSPKLRASASGNSWFEPAELASQVAIFVALVQNHIELEESTVYPAVKSLGPAGKPE